MPTLVGSQYLLGVRDSRRKSTPTDHGQMAIDAVRPVSPVQFKLVGNPGAGLDDLRMQFVCHPICHPTFK